MNKEDNDFFLLTLSTVQPPPNISDQAFLEKIIVQWQETLEYSVEEVLEKYKQIEDSLQLNHSSNLDYRI